MCFVIRETFVHWSWDESKKEFFSWDLASFLVCARNFIWLHAFLFTYFCRWHTPIRTWSTSELRPSLHTQVHDTCAQCQYDQNPTEKDLTICPTTDLTSPTHAFAQTTSVILPFATPNLTTHSWCLIPNRPSDIGDTKITMKTLFDLRSEYTNQDLKPIAPDWSQPSYVTHTTGGIANTMNFVIWVGPPTEIIVFTDLTLVSPPSHSFLPMFHCDLLQWVCLSSLSCLPFLCCNVRSGNVLCCDFLCHVVCVCVSLLTPGTTQQVDLSVVHFCRSFDNSCRLFCHALDDVEKNSRVQRPESICPYPCRKRPDQRPAHMWRKRPAHRPVVDVIYYHLKNLVWVKLRDYVISRANPNILIIIFLVWVVMIW